MKIQNLIAYYLILDRTHCLISRKESSDCDLCDPRNLGGYQKACCELGHQVSEGILQINFNTFLVKSTQVEFGLYKPSIWRS